MAHDVFISHSSKDKTVADMICSTLEAKGIRCWIAPRDINPGASYLAEIIKGVRGSRSMVVLMSAHANEHQDQIMREVERAVKLGLPIIPFSIENVLRQTRLSTFYRPRIGLMLSARLWSIISLIWPT